MRRVLTTAAMLIAIAALAAGTAVAQNGDGSWTAPKTPFGHPDLQGVWANNNATPLQRPEVLGDREFLTDEELAALQSRANELFALDGGDAAFGDSVFTAALNDAKDFTSRDRATGNYNQFWLVRTRLEQSHLARYRPAQWPAAGDDAGGQDAGPPTAARGGDGTPRGPMIGAWASAVSASARRGSGRATTATTSSSRRRIMWSS